jgi:hypothetical protein
MKRNIFITVLISLFIISIHQTGCKKKTEEKECKTCKAYGVDGLVGEEQVCTDSEETSFRSKYAGKEISCQ